ncbi:MAG: sortase [Sphingobacteriia bacterium]|nr:sortase [Sphingobacteriia bacterium]
MKINPNNLILTLGVLLISVSLFILGKIFFPVVREELKYSFSSQAQDISVVSQKELKEENNQKSAGGIIVPVDEEFGIVIPKILANAKVIAEVNPWDARVYQGALTEGVAHAQGSALPGEIGNIFIFAHSGADLVEANRYNAVFYLLYKLAIDDEIYLFYKGEKYIYRVKEKKTVGAQDVSYLKDKGRDEKLTLMTCWPPGTTMKRLIVTAEKK